MLSDRDKANQRAFNKRIAELIDQLHDIGGTRRGSDQLANRQLAYARTKLEEAGQWVNDHYFKNVVKPAREASKAEIVKTEVVNKPHSFTRVYK